MATIKQSCRFQVNSLEYLRQFETVFLRPIERGYDAIPVGNGDLAAVVWQPDHLTWMLNKCDISGKASQAARLVFETPKKLSERVGRLETRLSLAEATVKISYEGGKVAPCGAWRGRQAPTPQVTADDRGDLTVSGYVPHNRNVLLIDYHESPGTPHPITLVFERWVQAAWGDQIETYAGERTLTITYQLKDGTNYAAVLAYDGFAGAELQRESHTRTILKIPPNREVKGRVSIAVVTSHEAEDPHEAAMFLALGALSSDPTELRATHLAAWRDFWQRSFVDAGHPYANALYHTALYELGVTSQGRRPVKFNGALNLWNDRERTWDEGYTCHNQHSTYLPVYAANHVELAENFHDWIVKVHPQTVRAARKYFNLEGAYYPEYMSHDFTITAPETLALDEPSYQAFLAEYAASEEVNEELDHMAHELRYILSSGTRYASLLWSRYQYTLDQQFLAEKAYPVLRDVAMFYVNYGKLEEDGHYHVSPSLSWEERPLGRDAHSDCAAWRAIFTMAMEAANLLKVDRHLVVLWRERLRKAPDYPVEDGVFSVILRENGTPEPPEHFQWQLPNLSGVYPYSVIGLDSSTALRKTAERTFERYRFNADAGHEYLPVLAARLGKPDWWRAALYQYIQFFQTFDQGLFNYYGMQGNKDEDYRENSDGVHPYLESSGIFATAINEMLLQSHNNVIRVFPAVPPSWQARFILLAVGAFLVASEHRGRDGIPYIAVQPIGGKERVCRMVLPWKEKVELTSNGQTIPFSQLKTTIQFDTTPGRVYVLTRQGLLLEDIPLVEVSFSEAYSPCRLGGVWYGNREGANNHTSSFPLW